MASKRSRWQNVDKSEIPVKQLIGSFLFYQENQNHTPKTVEFYQEKLNRSHLGAERRSGHPERNL